MEAVLDAVKEGHRRFDSSPLGRNPLIVEVIPSSTTTKEQLLEHLTETARYLRRSVPEEDLISLFETILAIFRGHEMADMQAIADNLINGDALAVKEGVEEALAEGSSAEEVLNGALLPGMDEVGHRFKANEFYVPEVLIAARAMHAGMDVLNPLLTESDVPKAGKVAIGTVKGDLHDIGKNLVAMMLEGGGFEVIDLGANTSPEKFIEAIREEQPDIIGMSALLTTTMVNMEATIKALIEAGVRDQVKVMIGGAPVTQRYADEIGADGYAPDAASAVDLARSLVGA